MTATTKPNRLEPGDEAPSFDLPNQHGERVRLDDLRGQRVILYTYPKAFTPGCTDESCSFRDARSDFEEAGFTVIGLSSDAPERNRDFDTEHGLGFTVLSDEDHAVQEAYGAWGERNKYGKVSEGPIRSTFVIDADGRIEQALYNVKATGHVDRVRKLVGLAG